jgi:aldose 1-epimerase
VDDNTIPTGTFTNVAGTPFDFGKPTAIGTHINDDDPMLENSRGYDLNWVIKKPPEQLGFVARVVEPNSGRVMEVWSDEPGVQFYTGNSLAGIAGKGGQTYQAHGGFCLEPEHYPDSPNQPAFPSTELKPGQTFHNNIIYKFSVEK